MRVVPHVHMRGLGDVDDVVKRATGLVDAYRDGALVQRRAAVGRALRQAEHDKVALLVVVDARREDRAARPKDVLVGQQNDLLVALAQLALQPRFGDGEQRPGVGAARVALGTTPFVRPLPPSAQLTLLPNRSLCASPPSDFSACCADLANQPQKLLGGHGELEVLAERLRDEPPQDVLHHRPPDRALQRVDDQGRLELHKFGAVQRREALREVVVEQRRLTRVERAHALHIELCPHTVPALAVS